jgi:hypothetical protein
MSSHLDDPKYWRGRAAEIRALAEGLKDEVAKRMLEAAAADYDRLAARSEARLAGKKSN